MLLWLLQVVPGSDQQAPSQALTFHFRCQFRPGTYLPPPILGANQLTSQPRKQFDALTRCRRHWWLLLPVQVAPHPWSAKGCKRDDRKQALVPYKSPSHGCPLHAGRRCRCPQTAAVSTQRKQFRLCCHLAQANAGARPPWCGARALDIWVVRL